MARPKSETVEYFPHTCNHGKTMFILEQRYGNDGYSFWFKLLEMLGSTPGHVLDGRNDAQWEFLQAKTRLDAARCTEILDLLARLGAIDGELWSEKSLIWCQNFVDGVSDVYTNRRVKTPAKPSFYSKKPGADVVSTDENRQSKVNETKGERESGARNSEEGTADESRRKTTGSDEQRQNPGTDTVTYPHADHVWKALTEDFIWRPGEDLSDTKLVFLSMQPGTWPEVIIAKQNYAKTREVADGVLMYLESFLRGKYRRFLKPEQPLGQSSSEPGDELAEALRDESITSLPDKEFAGRKPLSVGALKIFREKNLPWPELRRQYLSGGLQLSSGRDPT